MTRAKVEATAGWEAALREIEHQAQHWETPEHGEVGHLIAMALLSAVEIARSGGLRCEHRGYTESAEPRGDAAGCGDGGQTDLGAPAPAAPLAAAREPIAATPG
jgi:hypothetical protein